MSSPPSYSAFARAYPSCVRQIDSLMLMENAISSISFPTFFEQVSVLDDFGPQTSPKSMGPLAGLLMAWTRHVGYGTIARIRSLTEPVIHHLVEGKLTVASILQRTILENAGRAAFAVDRLTECSNKNKWDDLRSLIPKALFGTCMTALEDTMFEDYSSMPWRTLLGQKTRGRHLFSTDFMLFSATQPTHLNEQTGFTAEC